MIPAHHPGRRHPWQPRWPVLPRHLPELAGGQKLLGVVSFVNDIHTLGLDTAQGLLMTESFYWDLNDHSRAFTERILPKAPDNYSNQCQAGAYSAALHYLKALGEVGLERAKASDRKIVELMKRMLTDDDAFGPGSIRADGRKLHDVHLFEVKKPEESRGPWDYLKLARTTPAAGAFRPLAEGGCPLVKARRPGSAAALSH
ncbi:ABC transporter substrate-binding protein [Teichococcus oryzae]|uniref:ABC transporter substrate-binding protein n=1 Tax=Teichococcus oryzae TaxID=1608942 RepID=UPI001F501553|nr:ABC transporter substrate-binding protein [Pseudoroseomonas oryzae]